MHKEKAIKHWMAEKGLTRIEANDKWTEERGRARFVKHDGPGGEDRIPVRTDDFLIAEDAVVDEKVATKEHKRAKFNEDVAEQMNEALQGRAMSSEDVKSFGLEDHPDLVNDFLGANPTPMPVSLPASANDGANPEHGPGPTIKKIKTFDCATERISCQNKLLQTVDKLFGELRQIQQDAEKALCEVPNNADTPNNELEARRLVKSRSTVAWYFMGHYEAGKMNYDADKVDADQGAFESELNSNNAELPEFIKQAPCFLSAVTQLAEAIKQITTLDDKKSLESDFKPVLNVMSLMKTSLKGATEKLRRFAKDRAVREEKAKRQEELATSKKLAADQKKREAEKTRLTKAAERQGKVASIWDVDFVKLNVRPVEILSMDTVDVKTLDWGRPWVLKSDAVGLAAVNALLAHAKVKSSLDAFYTGFPGSAAAMQGTKRFTQPVAETSGVRADLLKELCITEKLPEGKQVNVLGVCV